LARNVTHSATLASRNDSEFESFAALRRWLGENVRVRKTIPDPDHSIETGNTVTDNTVTDGQYGDGLRNRPGNTTAIR
jgi:hypothetical protein